MSLAVLANHMASKGRNGDSMLVHMTPGEVHGLQALAMKHGGSLTVNPDTGLPEANFLKSLLPMLAGFALGPAGFGLVSSAMGAGAIVGGITGIATGSLSKGLMAGLGAYGGFGIGEGLIGAGAGTAASNAAAMGVEGAATGANSQAAMLAKQNAGFGAEGLTQLADSAKVAAGATPSTTGMLSTGFDAALKDPMAFAKQNWKPIAAAALPVLSDIGTTTPGQAPTPMSPGRIREKRWDGRQFVDVASTDAGVYNTSGRSYSDFNRGYNDGGIVALAHGGDVVRMAAGTPPAMLDDAALFKQTGSWEAAAAARDAQNNAQNAYDWQQQADARDQAARASNITADADRLRAATNTNVAAPVDYNALATNYVNTAAANPNITTADFITGANTANIGLTQPLSTALQNSGLSLGSQYALTHADIGPSQNVAETYGGLKGLSNNINYTLASYNADPANKDKTGKEKQADALTALGKYNLNEADVKRATGKTLAELFPETVIKKVTNTGLVPTVVDATQNTTTNVASPTDLFTAPASSLPVGVSGNTGPSQIGGGATVNPNGTITTSPRIPGIPVGGFTGSKNLRDTYTKGGGSLGYTSPKFDNLDDFTEKYVNKRMSGDSLAAYNYLSGKGGAKYPVKSGVGQISEDYATAVLGYPARGNLPYIYNKATGKMDPNPDYVAPGRDDKGNVTYSMSTNDIKSALKDTPMSGQALYDWAMSNKLSAQQIADATGQSLSQVYAQFRAGSKAKAATDKKVADDKAVADAANSQLDSSSTGGEAAGGLQRSYAMGGYAVGGGLGSLGSYSDGGRLLRGPGDGVSDSIPATIGQKQQPARLADGEFVVPARIVSELGNGSTEAGAKKLYAMMDRVQRARGKTTGKNKVAANSRADKYLPA